MNKDEKRQARILALQMFFSYEQQNFEGDIRDVFNEIAGLDEIDDDSKSDDLAFVTGEVLEVVRVVADSPAQLSDEAKKYAFDIAQFTAENRERIDRILSTRTQNWAFDRLGAVDRNLLRIAIAEFDKKFDAPVKVVMNEAIEIAKVFGSDDSAKFVNAILDKVKLVKVKKEEKKKQKQE